MALEFSSPSFPRMVRKKRTGKRKAIKEEETTLNDDASGLKIDVDDIISQTAKGDPTKLRLKDLFKQQLAAIDRTPDHPVYAIMIQEAITDLNEEGGSTREAISEFILGKYDVIKVVHSAKLIDQLRKLVGRQEIILTSKSRYKVPVESTTDVADLELVEQGLSLHEQDGEGCKPCNSEEVYLLRGPDEFNENQCHTKIGEMNRTMGSQIEEQDVRVCKPCAVEGHLRENNNTISEEQYQLQIEPLKESPVSHLAGSVSQNNSQEEQTPQVIEMMLDDERSTKMFDGSEDNESSVPPGFQIEGSESETLIQEEQIVTTTGGQIFHVNEENEKVTDKEAPCGQHVNQFNDERDAEEVQVNREETQATEGLSQEKGKAPKEVKDKLQNVGYLVSSVPSKEKFTELRKRIETMEQEIRNIIDHLSSVDVPEHVTSLNKAEVFLVPESDPKTVPHPVDTSQDSMQHMWNHQTGDDITKQKEKGNTCSREEVFKSQLKLMVTSADSLLMDLEQLALRKRQCLSSSECFLEVCGTQKLSECDLVGSSSLPGPLECQMLDLEQQLEPGMQGPEKRKLSESPVQDMDSNCQQKHVKCNAAAMASDEVQIPEKLPNINPEAADNLAGTRKRKRQWQLQHPKRKGLRLRSHGGSQPAETKAENLQSQHVSSRKVRKRLDGRLRTPKLSSNVDAFESQIKRRGRPKEKATSRTAWRKKVS